MPSKQRDLESELRSLAGLAAQLCGVASAAVSLEEEEGGWRVARVGAAIENSPVFRALCLAAEASPALLELSDLHLDARFSALAQISGGLALRFFAGAPIYSLDGRAVGAFCIADLKPRTLSPEQRTALDVLARQAGAWFQLRQAVSRLEEAGAGLRDAKNALAQAERALQLCPAPAAALGENGVVLDLNPAALRLLEADSLEQARGLSFKVFLTPDGEAGFDVFLAEAFAGRDAKAAFELMGFKGSPRRVLLLALPLRGPDGNVAAVLVQSSDLPEPVQGSAYQTRSEPVSFGDAGPALPEGYVDRPAGPDAPDSNPSARSSPRRP